MGLNRNEWKGTLEGIAKENRVGCAAALAAAGNCGATPAEIGDLLDEMGLRIDTCQLGLFGYGPGKQKRIQVPDEIPAGVGAWVTDCANGKGHTTCAEIFAYAKAHGTPRGLLAGACEAMGLKIRSCQLGAF